MVMLPLNNDNWRSVFPVMAGDLSETIVTFGNASDGLLVAMVTNLQLPRVKLLCALFPSCL